MPLFPPLFAKGKANVKTITAQVIGASDTAVTVDTATGLSVGMHVFASDAGGTANVEYLGKIKTIVADASPATTSTITTQHRARFARVNGASLWSPAASWQAATVLSLGSQDHARDRGIEKLQTTAARGMRTKTRDTAEYIDMMWSLANTTDFVAMETWLIANAGDGLGTFTAAFADRKYGYVRCCQVTLDDADREFKAKTDLCVLRSWVMRFAIAASDSYL